MNSKQFFRHQLALALASNSRQKVFLGTMPAKKFASINLLRHKYQVPPISSPAIFIYPNVINKLICKRIQIGQMSIPQLVDVATKAIFGTNSIILPSRYRHIQLFTALENDNIANCVYISKYDNSISVKSIYLNDIKDINRQILESGG